MDPYNFQKQIKESFHNYYMTMIGIIQGTAFSFLVYNICNSWDKINFINNLNLFFYILNVIITFLIIVAICYEYVTFASVWRWSLKGKDILIPLMLGMLQSCLYFNIIKIKNWWITMLLLNIVGFYAYNHTKSNIEKEYFEYGSIGNKIYEKCIEVANKNFIFLSVGIILSSLEIMLFYYNKFLHLKIAIYIICIFFIFKFINKQEK